MSTATTAPAGPAPERSTFIRVRTNLPRRPLPPNSARQPILTPRLILRPLVAEDLAALHELRTQPEVMRWTALGRPDRNLDESRAKLEPFLPPRDVQNFNFGICERETGQLIGLGGCHLWTGAFGWPEIGYMFRKEVWGRGLATEFVGAWLRAWEGLEREEVVVEVDGRSVEGLVVVEEEGKGEDGVVGRVREMVLALTAEGNDKSQRVLGKNGFEWFATWQDKDMSEGAAEGSTVDLPTFRYFSGGKKEQ